MPSLRRHLLLHGPGRPEAAPAGSLASGAPGRSPQAAVPDLWRRSAAAVNSHSDLSHGSAARFAPAKAEPAG